jgi:hypothetical protein
MPRPKGIRVFVLPGYQTKLEAAARAVDLPLDDYVTGVVIEHALHGATRDASAPPNRGGRPATVQPDDLPPAVERSPTPSGFAGVTPRGRFWVAKLGRETLGRFSSPELAATVRHYTLLGFRVGRGAYFVDDGMAPEAAAELTARIPFGALPVSDSGAGPIIVRPAAGVGPAAAGGAHPQAPGGIESTPAGGPSDDPPEGPETSEGSREAPADRGRAASTSTGILPWGDLIRQVEPAPTVRRTRGCPVCAGAMNRGVARTHPALCLLCSDDYDVWEKLQAGGAPPEPIDGEVFVSNAKGAPAAESFAEYVARVRAL